MPYNFHTTYTGLNSNLFHMVDVPKIRDSKCIVFNENLRKKLGIKFLESDDPRILLGKNIKEQPFAQAYAGHQFGHFNRLGDGRAMILGEHITPENKRFDIQLKGSGRTPYSRGGDGKATVNSMLREFLYSCAMKNLGIESSQSLAVLSTNEKVIRHNVSEGAILVRVMKSHIRFGTFEYVAHFCSEDEFRDFTDYVIERHYPHLEKEENKYVKFYKAVIQKILDMVINWYRVGFVHGVMNTDNMSIVGETFDYGPCAFMNRYNPVTTYSEIDTQKRYCFINQMAIAQWNIAVFGKSLLPLFDKDFNIAEKIYKKEIEAFEKEGENQFLHMMKGKLGITDAESHKKLIGSVLHFFEMQNLDYTNTFIELMYPGSFEDPIYTSDEFLYLRSEIEKVGGNRELMVKNNPQRILRNYLVEEALDEYEKTNSLEKFHNLLDAISLPYEKNERFNKFQIPPSIDFDRGYSTHCNT